MLRIGTTCIKPQFYFSRKCFSSNTVPVAASIEKVEKKVDYKQYSEIMGKNEKLYPKYLAPSKDFRPDFAHDMPPAINPENWKSVTPEDLRAHQERQAIRGRLRREFWTKKYHPVNWRHFNPINTDPMYAKFNRARSVYYTLYDQQMSPKDSFKFFAIIIALIGFGMYAELGFRRSLEKNVNALHPIINTKSA